MSRALYRELTPTPLPVRTPAECLVAVEHFKTHGMAVIQLITEEEGDDLIIEQWSNIIDLQPYEESSKLRHVDPIRRRAEFLAFAKKANLSESELNARKDAWPMHVGFGACCDRASFHSQRIWDVRQSVGASTFARMALGRDDIWVDINRSIQKLQGEGENEFLHWDFDAFDPAYAAPGSQPRAVCGRVGYNAFSTILAPRSHTPEFFAEFQRQYAHIYPHLSNSKERNLKVGLQIEKPDPMNLFGNAASRTPSDWAVTVHVQPGCWLVWDERMLHGVVPNPRNGPTQYGMYLGYFPAGSRPLYEERTGVQEIVDRMDSYVNTRAPALWPSMDRVHYMPARFQNFPQPVWARMHRMPLHNSITWREVDSGNVLPSLSEPNAHVDFTPADLTDNGLLLLCGERGHGYPRA